MSSHVMELVESLCDKLAVVAQGRVLAAGTLDEVRAGSTLQTALLVAGGAAFLSVGAAGLVVMDAKPGGATPKRMLGKYSVSTLIDQSPSIFIATFPVANRSM